MMSYDNRIGKVRDAFLHFLIGGTLVLVAGCSSTEQLTSEPRSPQGAVDGYATEWEGKWKVLQDGALDVAVQNDPDSLYLCVEVRDRQMVRGIVFSGMTIWFDHKNGAKEKWGVRFPVGLGDPGTWRRGMGEPGVEAERSPDGQQFREELQQSVREMEIVGSNEKDVTQVSTATSEREYGIKVAMRDSEGPLVYELRIPRASKISQYALGNIKDNTLGIEIETTTMPMMGAGRRPSREGGGPPMGGRPPGGMGRGRGRSEGSPGGMRPGNTGEKISLSLEVHLL
jgi:hypothetical protein